MPENGEIQHTLLVAGVVLQDDAARKQGFQPLDQSCLILVLGQNITPSLVRGFLFLLLHANFLTRTNR